MESFGIEQIFTKLDSQVTKVEKMATDKLAELESNVKTFFSKSDNSFGQKLQLNDSMENLVGGKERLNAINSTANMVYESTKLFLNNNTSKDDIIKTIYS